MKSNENDTDRNHPTGTTLTVAEQVVVKEFFWWAKECEVIDAAQNRKLLQLVTEDGENLYWTMVSDPEPRLIFHEPVRFVVTVEAVKHGCNVGHQAGERWEFSRCTPNGMCSTAYHTMYPVLYGLMLSGGSYDGPASEGTVIFCPEDGEVKFLIERHLWTPKEWEEEVLQDIGAQPAN